MGIEEILLQTIVLLNSCHIMGGDAENFAGAIKNLRSCINAIKKAKKEDAQT